MSYVVLARKWRPQTFADLVGQDHVSRTIGNAIAQNRVAHAFLFTGVRGVGKTTSARILAKAMNCEQGPTTQPCLVCAACKEITAGVDVDVQEIDGASNTSVDDVRRIQESLPYRPARDRYKILIVDEVHMLSGNAWNAFLKTLEEPPPHVKFIFATTEVHKVPITILSRCQRYDFKLIAAREIAQRVRYILAEESIQADEAAIQLVAREAAGSMRDALSILDQVIAFSGKTLNGDEVARTLGVADRQTLHSLTSAIIEKRAADALRELDQLATQGFDLGHVARDLLKKMRDLVIVSTGAKTDDLLDLPSEEIAEMATLANITNVDDLTKIFRVMSQCVDEIARSTIPRYALEIAIVRLAQRAPSIAVHELVDRLCALEKRLQHAKESPVKFVPQDSNVLSSNAAPANVVAAKPPQNIPSQPRSSSASTTEKPRAIFETKPSSFTQERPRAHATIALASAQKTSVATDTQQHSQPTIVVPLHQPVVQSESVLSPETVARIQQILDRVRQQRAPWGALFEHGVITRCDSGGFEVAYERRSFLAAQVSEPQVAHALAQAVKETIGCAAHIFICDQTPQGISLATLASQARSAALEEKQRQAVDHPIVQELIKRFSADVVSVKIPGNER